MSNYTKSTNFATKDNLPTGDPLKIVKGTEIDTEFNNIATAIATKTDNSAAAITGGTITGITDLAIADGGTGASTATAALNNLLPSQASAANKYLQSDGTNASWDAISINTSDITGTLAVANGGTGVTSSTGTGSVVLSNSPTLVTPTLGAASASTLDVSGNVTLSGGTANAVPYLNGSKVITSGTELYFNGSNLGIGASASYRVDMGSATSDDAAVGIRIGRGGSSTTWSLIDNVGGSGNYRQYSSGTPTLRWLTSTDGSSWSEQMRLNATGLGVGNNNPAAKLDVTGSALISGTLGVTGVATLGAGAILNTPASATLTNATGLPISTGVSGLGTGVATALAVNVGSAGAPVVNGGALGTPSSGTVTNLTGTASININGTVGATTPTTGAFTTVNNSAGVRFNTSGTEYARMQLNSTSLELMAGSTFTAGITLNSSNVATLTNNPVLTAGTANGVTYLNGSKVLTSGSALTFDGTNLGIGISAGNYANYKNLAIAGTTGANIDLLSGSTIVGNIYNTATDVVIQNSTSGPMRFSINGSEGMRLTSTGLGIGTSSPAYKLDVVGAINASAASPTGFNHALRTTGVTTGRSQIYLNNTSGDLVLGVEGSSGGASYSGTAAYSSFVATSGANPFYVITNSAIRATFDSSGNLGLGVTPSAWVTLKAFEFGTGTANGSLYGYGNEIGLSTNTYYNGGYKYISSSAASQYRQQSGGHYWFTAPSGTAGNSISFTQAMTLDASGNLLVGKTSASTTTVGAELRATGNINSASASSTNADQTFLAYSTGAAASRFYVDWGGTVHATSTTISAISDQRLKENIRDLDEGLATVMALKPRKFDWKEGKGQNIKNARGFIAQEFETVLPDMIEEWRDPAPEGEEAYKAINVNLIPTLVKAIQELKAEFDAYKASHP